MADIDPATFEVVKNALYAAAEEMKVVLAKTAYSPLLKVAGDYSCGLFDVAGTGQLKPIVDRLFEKRATERAAQFADCLQKRFGAVPPASAPAQAPGGWIRRLWQGLLGRLARRKK